MAPATRWTMRLEPYDPDARDADNDGIVQEQTPWERPAGTSLVDELGRAITRGANAGQRPRGLRVVDQRGNTVDYTPTYERPGFSFGGGGTPLGEAGAPSLRERGLPSVRDITAPPPAPQMEPSLAPSLPPAVGLPGADAPEPPALRVDGRPKASAKEMAEASRIAKSIQESVEAEFGPLTTKQQVRDALNRAFPNASGNAEALLNSAEYWDENTPRVKAVRNFAIGLLHMSQQDPQTAARITRLNDLDAKDPNAGGVHSTRIDTYSGMFQSWTISMNPSLNVNSLEPEKREMGEPWAYKMALSMKETGDFSDDEINQILQQSVAIHEFGHAMHLSAGLSHWGNDRGGAVPSEAMIQAFANVKKISVSDANDEINAFIQKYYTAPRSDQTISEAITTLVRREPESEQAFFNELYDTIKWDGVDKDETTRAKILEDLSKASEYATTGGKRGQGSQYDEGIAETIAVMVATGTPASGGKEMLAHVQSIFPGSATAPEKPEAPEAKTTSIPAGMSGGGMRAKSFYYGDEEWEVFDGDLDPVDAADAAYSMWSGYDGNFQMRHVSAALMGQETPAAYGDEVGPKEINQILSTGKWEGQPEWAKEQAKESVQWATFIMDQVVNGEKTERPLYRGLSDVPDDADILNYKPGDTFTIPLSAFSPDQRLAEQFSTGTGEGKSVIIVVEPGARGYKAPEGYETQFEENGKWVEDSIEYVTNGDFEVVRTQNARGQTIVTLRHLQTYNSSGSKFSVKAEKKPKKRIPVWAWTLARGSMAKSAKPKTVGSRPGGKQKRKGSDVYEISTCSGFLERGPNGKFSPVGEPEPEKKLLEIDPLQSKIDLPSIRPGGRSGATRRLRTGARRGALALEPYDPDARDADGDGIVQEGTAWERPATARILDALGNEIRRGQQASVRPTGIRVVDRDGNDIDYKPTYEGGRAGTIGGSTIPQVRPSVKPPEALTPEKPAKKAAAKKPAKPKKETPLADHGARSLKERGLPSTREQYRAATTPPEPEAPEVPEAPEPKTPKAKKPKETPVVDDIALSPGVTLASADRPELEKPEKPRSPFKPSPPPLEGRAQELADEADGDFKKFMELLDKEGYVVFDYETTGLQDGNIPVQIGAVRIKDGKIVERFNVFTNPQRPLSDWSKENLKDKDGNPLTDEWLEGQTDLAEAHRQLAEFLGDSIIVAHNLPYDGEILNRMMKDADIDYKPSGSIDTLMLLRSAVPKGDGDSGPERHTLGSLADFFDVDLGDAAHTADADSEAAALVLQKAMNWSGDNDSSPDIFDAAKQKELFDAATKKYNADRKEYEVALKQYQADLADYERAVTRADEPVVETPSSPATQEVKLSYVPGDVGDILAIQRQFEAQYSWVEDDMEGFVEYELSPEDLKRVLEELDLPDKEALVKYMTDSAIARIGDYVDDVRRGPLYLSVTPQNLKKILEEKRFKSQFETGTSGGLFNPDVRRAIEDKYMGIRKDTPDELRPIYGFQLGEGEGDEVTRSGAAKAYGTIVVKLKDDVRGRTTMTAGDSLDHQLYGIPVDGDVTRERHLAAARRDYSQIWDQAKQGAMAEIVEDVLGGFYDWEEPYEDIITAGASPHYNEIQVHGGLTLDNVEEIIYPSDWGDDLRNEIIALLDQANIEHGEEW